MLWFGAGAVALAVVGGLVLAGGVGAAFVINAAVRRPWRRDYEAAHH